MMQEDRSAEEGQGIKEYAQRRQASGVPPHITGHLCATQWLRGGWPLWGGWPPEVFGRAAGAMFIDWRQSIGILIL